MKRFTKLSFLIVITFTTFSNHSFGQSKSFPFKVEMSGNGLKSIIFIPGFACSGDVWNETKSSYEKDYTCYTLTMAGFADVAPQPNPTFKNWENAIANFIQQNKIDQPIIIGHSMGGGLAMALAADYPELVSKIVVVDGLPCLSALMNPAFQSKENNDCSAIVSQMTASSDGQFYLMQKRTIPQLLADTSKQELVVSWSVKSDRATIGEMFCDFSNTDLRDKIATIKCPSLILLESTFANLKPAMNEQFKNLKTADLQYATKGLHFIMYDDKEWFGRQLQSFINR